MREIPRPDSGVKKRPSEAGFTLIEIMVVIMILGLVLRIVMVNMGAFIPSSALDAQANKLRFTLDYLRSEAKIQGKPYTLELDLDKHMTRIILPTEDKLVTTTDDTMEANIEMGWQPLEDWVKFEGHGIWGREIYTKNIIKVTFDENGFAADQTIFFRYDVEDNKRIWSVHVFGLNGTTTVVRNLEGKRDIHRAETEAAFQ